MPHHNGFEFGNYTGLSRRWLSNYERLIIKTDQLYLLASSPPTDLQCWGLLLRVGSANYFIISVC